MQLEKPPFRVLSLSADAVSQFASPFLSILPIAHCFILYGDLLQFIVADVINIFTPDVYNAVFNATRGKCLNLANQLFYRQ